MTVEQVNKKLINLLFRCTIVLCLSVLNRFEQIVYIEVIDFHKILYVLATKVLPH